MHGSYVLYLINNNASLGNGGIILNYMKKFYIFFACAMISIAGFAQDDEVTINGVKYRAKPYENEATVLANNYQKSSYTIPATITVNGNKYTVTKIGYEAFRKCKNLTSITLPNTIKRIHEYAFETCSGLKSINIPNSVEQIDSWSFNGTSITTVRLPNSIKDIDFAFNGCKSLTTVILPNTTFTLSDSSFGNCDKLTTFYSLADDPSKITLRFYSFDYDGKTLYVKKGLKSKYQSAPEWKKFPNIVEMSDAKYKELTNGGTTGIETVSAEQTAESAKIVEDGRVTIVKNGKKFNTAGQLMK